MDQGPTPAHPLIGLEASRTTTINRALDASRRRWSLITVQFRSSFRYGRILAQRPTLPRPLGTFCWKLCSRCHCAGRFWIVCLDRAFFLSALQPCLALAGSRAARELDGESREMLVLQRTAQRVLSGHRIR